MSVWKVWIFSPLDSMNLRILDWPSRWWKAIRCLAANLSYFRCMIHGIYHFGMMKRGRSAASSCEIRKRYGRLTSDHVYMRVFFNKMIPMNILCSSGFLTNSFMMKVHKILNLFLFNWVAFFLLVLLGKLRENLSLPVLQKSRFVSPLFYYHNGCTRDSWKFQTGSCNLWNVSETSRQDRKMTKVFVMGVKNKLRTRSDFLGILTSFYCLWNLTFKIQSHT